MGQIIADVELKTFIKSLEGDLNLRFLNDMCTENQNINKDKLKKIRYQLYCEEIQEMVKRFNAKSIKFVVMKGVALAQELYSEPWIRDFGDIDLLVSPEDLVEAIEILEKMEYTTERKTDKDSIEGYLDEINREHHLPPFVKQSKVWFPFIIELHVDIVPIWMFQIDSNLTKKILSRRKTAQKFPQMEKYDELIFQMLHLVKHYVFEMTMGFMSGNIQAKLNIRDLHEIALLLEKWKGKFDEGKFVERVNEYTVENEIMLVIKWLRDIYPVASQNLINVKLKRRDKGCFVNRFCGLDIGRDIQKILLDNPQIVASEIIDNLHMSALTVHCVKNTEVGIWPGDNFNWIEMDNKKAVRDNRFGTYLVAGKYKRQAFYCTQFCFSWDEKYLYFYVKIVDPNANFYHHNSKAEIFEIKGYDYIRLHFDTSKREKGEPFVRAYNFKPYYTQSGDIEVLIEEEFHCTGGGIHVLQKGTCITFIKKQEDNYFLKIGLPWEILQYHPDPTLKLYFDVWLRTDDFIMEWQSAYHAWYDIAEYGRLKLC